MGASNQICLLNGVVQTIIFADSDFVTMLLNTGKYDQIVPQSNYPNQLVNPGFILSGGVFAAPASPPVDPQIQVQLKIQKAILGFNTIMVQYAAQNVLMGITQAGKTQLIADTLTNVLGYGQTGSLYCAITALQNIQLTPEMAPFLTSQVISNLVSQAQSLLASL